MTVEATNFPSLGRRQAAVALMIATAMQAFDSTIANVALPQLEQSLGGGIDLGSWVMTSYLCAAAVMATLTGWIRRRYGARQAFGGAIILFVASLLCSISPSQTALISFRLVQGAAAGIIQPLAQAIILDLYPKRHHGRLLAIWGATIMAGPIMGPVMGGVITDLASWRWIFVLNIPLGVIAILGLGQVPTSVEQHDGNGRIDSLGILFLIVGVGALQLSLERSIIHSWPPSTEVSVEAMIAIMAFLAITARSIHVPFSLFRFEVFKDINFATSIFYNFVVGALV